MTSEQGFIAIFLLIMSVFGSILGAAFGYVLDGVIQSRRLLAIVAAFSAVVLAVIIRSALGKSFPSLFFARQGTTLRFPVWFSACLTSLLGGLAGHDLVQLFGTPLGPIVGFISGTLATLSLSVLVILYLYKHPEEGVPF
jgi:hypothetical protein